METPTTKQKIYTLENEYLRFKISNFGLRIIELSIKEDDNWHNIVLSYENIEDNLTDENYLNCIIGPFAGRLRKGSYKTKNDIITYDANEGSNCLHSGSKGLHRLYFDIEKQKNSLLGKAVLDDISYLIKYTLENNCCIIKIKAIPRYERYINMTQHTYFNLSGENNVCNHILKVPANELFLLDKESIPVRPMQVYNTIFDLRTPQNLNYLLKKEHEQFSFTKHIDHPFNTEGNSVLLCNKASNICVSVKSNASKTIIYLGNHLGRKRYKMSNNNRLEDYAGIAIEPQELPNCVNLLEGKELYTYDNPFERTITYEDSHF